MTNHLTQAAELPRAQFVRTVTCVVFVIVAVVVVASHLGGGTEAGSSPRRRSVDNGILQDAGHVLKRTVGPNIERF